MTYQLITSDAELAIVCEKAQHYPAVALDTEFVRTRTYYPQLGLIQLFDGETVTLIDPLSITQWQPFITLLENKNVVKYLHACSEDLEVFLHSFKTMPVPMIDTQVLAAFCGHPLSCGFATLVAQYEAVELDKSESRTDWLARPLTQKQCDYAAADVIYLLPMAAKLMAEVTEKGWLTAALNECEQICQRRETTVKPEEAYRNISGVSKLTGRSLACLQLLAAWRLRYAQQRDKTQNFVVHEESLWIVAKNLPTSMTELNALGLKSPEIRYHGQTMLDCVSQAKQCDDDLLPADIHTVNEHQAYKSVFKALKAQITQCSQSCGLSVELLASRRQINQLLSRHWQLTPNNKTPILLSGWRYELLGEALQAVLVKYPT